MHIRRCRRGLVLAGLALALLAGPASVRADAPPLPDPTATDVGAGEQSQITAYVAYFADQIQSAADDTTQQSILRDQMLKPLNSIPSGTPISALFAYDFGSQVASKFGPLLSNPKTALNATIIAAQVDNMSTESLFETALTNSSAAVRYWAAKGMGEILPALAQIGPSYQQAAGILQKAAQTEQDPMAAAQIALALSQVTSTDSGVAEAIITMLDHITANYNTQIPNDLLAVGQIANDLAQTVQNNNLKLSADDQLAAMTALTNLISFAAQYYAAGMLDYMQTKSAPDTIGAAIEAMNIVSGGNNFTIQSNTDPAALLMKINDITGAPGINGLVQKLYAKVPVPARIQIAHPQ